jgi:hypothetical protein
MRIVIGPSLKFRVTLVLQPNFTFNFEILRWLTSPIFEGSDYLVYLVYKKKKILGFKVTWVLQFNFTFYFVILRWPTPIFEAFDCHSVFSFPCTYDFTITLIGMEIVGS